MEDKILELTRQLHRLELKNKELEERVRQLENPTPDCTAKARQQRDIGFRVGDRIRVFRPTCPGTNRQVIPEDGFATVTRVLLLGFMPELIPV